MKLTGIVLALWLVASLLPAYGGGEHGVTILYSSSLNGNIDGCDCKGNPKAGLVKRAAWLRVHREADRSVLVDAGDLLDVFPDPLLSQAILDTYDELGYDAVAVGDQELADGVEALLAYRSRYPLYSHNLSLCPDDTRCVFFSLRPLLLDRGGLRIGLFALIDADVFALYPEELKKALKIAPPEVVAPGILEDLRDQGAEMVILLYHGFYEKAKALALGLEGLDVLVAGHEQRLIDAEQAGGTIIVSPGAEGNRLGILTVAYDGRGRIRIDNRFELFRWDSSPDDPAVRRRVEEYRAEMRRRVNER
jgi:2',3'-cyclic-nucleotide 2'-phosphodiesterase (5'-nucleotidase family)